MAGHHWSNFVFFLKKLQKKKERPDQDSLVWLHVSLCNPPPRNKNLSTPPAVRWIFHDGELSGTRSQASSSFLVEQWCLKSPRTDVYGPPRIYCYPCSCTVAATDFLGIRSHCQFWKNSKVSAKFGKFILIFVLFNALSKHMENFYFFKNISFPKLFPSNQSYPTNAWDIDSGASSMCQLGP